DNLVSHVLDEMDRHPTFEKFAEALGFYTLDRAAATEDEPDPNADLKALFAAVCEADDPSDEERKNFRGRGWKGFGSQDGSALAAAWRACLDPADYETSIQRITGARWTKLMGRPGIELKGPMRHGCKIGLCFYVGNYRGHAVFNADILKDKRPAMV